MNLPKHSGAILCPTGEHASMVSDYEFALIMSTETIHCETVGKPEFGQWLCNARQIESQVNDDDAETLSQWSIRPNGTPDTENLGDHPWPLNVFGNGIFSDKNGLYYTTARFPNSTPYWSYRKLGDGAAPGPVIPYFLFIHRDEFYWAFDHLGDPDDMTSCSISTGSMRVSYTNLIGTTSFLMTITDRFFP